MGKPENDDHAHGEVMRAREKYAAEWSRNAARFARDGHYRWMAGFVPGGSLVLEIGPGDGSGTSALLDRGLAVIALEENPACLDRAQALLQASARQIVRHCLAAQSVGNAGPGPWPAVPGPGGAMLVEGDLLDDDALNAFPAGFGTVVCWLAGTYAERAQSNIVRALSVSSPDQYRLAVHERVFGLARRLLPAGGIVHLVDRCVLAADDTGAPAGSPRWLAGARDAYASLAASYGFAVSTITLREYSEPQGEDGPAVELTRSKFRHDSAGARMAFISVVFVQNPVSRY
jgi:hypothetical protein